VTFQACYCSLYDECWLVSTDGQFEGEHGGHLRDDDCSAFEHEERNRWWRG
jgi:hypothetical protein